MESENKNISSKLKADKNTLYNEDGKQIGVTYYTNFKHDERGRKIKDTSAEDMANEITKRYNMHNELIEGLKYARRFLDKTNVDMEYIDKLLKQT